MSDLKDVILKSIEPRSDQLNADDLIAGPIDATVVDVKQGDAEQPIAILIDGGRQPFKPCKSMRRLLVRLWGDAPKKWIGNRMRLYCDPDVKFGGMRVGGIRISHMSGIPSRTEIMLTVTRGKRVAYIVEPMPNAAPEQSRAEKAIAAIESAHDQPTLEKYQLRLEQTWDDFTADERKQLKKAIEEAAKRIG